MDVADSHGGVTIVSVDAPLIQLDAIHTDAIVTGWVDSLPVTGTVFSYVMNNYWETNYRAAQEGPNEWRYAIRLHQGFDAAHADRWARGVAQPLITVAVPVGRAPLDPPFAIDASRAVVTGVEMASDGNALLVRLYNPAATADTVTIGTRTQHSTVTFSGVRGARGDPVRKPLVLMPRAFASIRIDLARPREP